ncbi:MAG TPA: DUF4097 family beta strand repeat-containing protein [Longimicrobiales bacterium]
MKRLALLVGALALTGCDLDLAGIGMCEYSRDFSDEISASGLNALLADAQAGELRIEGRSGSNKVRVRATACASDARTADDIDFVLDYTNTSARVTSYVPGYDHARLDLVIEVPVDFDVDVYDESGDVEVRNVNSLWIDDGSGDIDARHIWYDVLVADDGSGDIYAEDLGGDFVVQRDGSGRIDYQNVRGRVQLP